MDIFTSAGVKALSLPRETKEQIVSELRRSLANIDPAEQRKGKFMYADVILTKQDGVWSVFPLEGFAMMPLGEVMEEVVGCYFTKPCQFGPVKAKRGDATICKRSEWNEQTHPLD